MEFRNFNSSAIDHAAYESQTQTLTIWFTRNPQGYDYPGVPPHIWQGLQLARSAGTYYNAYIRDQYGLGRRPTSRQRHR
ncbi:MAG: hypothetical protein A2486_07210 [Burkholderiales bacterium RIFOXYC12_FULL_65_23]|uniref:KTSC domain-containing protein n=1 Tax=Malikia spinosa TaxID=86180 RepID=UPI0008CB11DC|nr:MAG: hypothetical protein A2486_07210 [Burkholderiales bacterium RIFOXYC12_FULL_65_23]